MSDSARGWEAALFRRLLGRRWLALLLVVALQVLLVVVLAAVLWGTRVKDTVVGQAQVEPATGLVMVNVGPRDIDKLEAGRPVALSVDAQDGLSQFACDGQVAAIRADGSVAVATVDLTRGAEGSCAEVKRLLTSGQPTKVTVQARTRRLLLLLLGG